MPDYAVSTTFKAHDRISQIFGRIGNASDKFAGRASKNFDKVSRSAGRTGDIIKGILAANVVQASFRQFKMGIGSVIEETANVENAIVSFKVLTGSIADATKLVGDLRAEAATTPFEFTHLSDTVKTLMGFGVATQKTVIPIMRRLGDVAMGDAERLGSITLAYSQIQAAGKASMQDINQLINAGVPIMKELQRQTGLTMEELRKGGRITARHVEKAFIAMTSKGGLFFQGMAEGSKTLSGRWSTLVDNVKLIASTVGLQLLPYMKTGLDLVIAMTERTTAWAEANKGLIASRIDMFIAGLKSAWQSTKPVLLAVADAAVKLAPVFKELIPLLPVLIGGFVAYSAVMKGLLIVSAVSKFIQLITAAHTLAGAMGVVNIIMAANPIGIVIAGITALVAAVIWLERRYNLFSEAYSFWSDLISRTNPFSPVITAIKSVIGFFVDLEKRFNLFSEAYSFLAGKISAAKDMLGFGDTTVEAPNRTAPNREEVEARQQQVGFEGTLNIAGAPAGSTFESKGAPALRVNMLGAQ